MTKQKRRPSKREPAGSGWGAKVLLALAVPAIAFGFFLLRPSSDAPKGSNPATKLAYVRKETRPTLSPARFVGKAARAHEVAREIPDILDQLHCYCECEKHMGHKSLLSCYTDGHAGT